MSLPYYLAVAGGLFVADRALHKEPLHDEAISQHPDVPFAIKYNKVGLLFNINPNMVSFVEQMPNNTILGAPRYFVHLKDGTVVETYGPVTADYVSPRF